MLEPEDEKTTPNDKNAWTFDENDEEVSEEETEIQFSDRRRYKRVKAKVDVKYSILNRAVNPQNTQSRDISGGGVRMTVTVGSEVRVGDELSMEMHLADKTVSATAIVKWKRGLKGREKGLSEAGVEFLSINESERTKIIDFVEHYDQWVSALKSKFGNKRVQSSKPKTSGPATIKIKRPPRKK